MSTETAPRNLWQLPTFVLGVLSLLGIWYAKPYIQLSAAERFQKDLNTLRIALEKSSADPETIAQLLQRVESFEPAPAQKTLTDYVVGSAHLMLAEAAAPNPEAATGWKVARQHLEAVQSEHPQIDRQRLNYRLGKTWANSDDVPPAKVIELLSNSLQSGDDPAEGYRLLAHQYLRIQEVKKARDAMQEYLSRALPRTNSEMLNQARLKLGELYTQLNEVENARKVLERVGPDASVDVYVSARSQLAKGYMLDGDWTSAIRSWEQAKEARGTSNALKSTIHYELGICYAKVNRTNEAVQMFELARKGTGPEQLAATFKLAELQARQPKNREAAIKLIESALDNINKPEHFQNPLLDITEARLICESILNQYKAENEYDLAMRFLRSYTKIADAGKDRLLTAETYEQWATALLKEAEKNELERPKLEEAALKQFRQAAEELSSLLPTKIDPNEQQDLLKRTANLFAKAGDNDKAKQLLENVVAIPKVAGEMKEESLYQKALKLLENGDRKRATTILEQMLQEEDANKGKARFQLAKLAIEANTTESLDKALEMLKINVEPEGQKDPETHEQSLYLMGFTYFQQRNWKEAERRFDDAIRYYPNSKEALKARFSQGRCFWYTAAQEAEKLRKLAKVLDSKPGEPDAPPSEEAKTALLTEQKNLEKSYRDFLAKAWEPYQKVEALLLEKQKETTLTLEESRILRQAGFAHAECAFFLGEYETCITQYESLSQRYVGKLDQLAALSQLWQCYFYLKKPDNCQAVMVKMKTVYQKLTDADFIGSSDSTRRDFWEKWIAEAEEAVKSMPRQ